MIVVDSSAILSILGGEPDGPMFLRRLTSDRSPVMSVPTALECSIVARRLRRLNDPDSEAWLDAFLEEAGAHIEAATPDDLRLARGAFARFGKGTGHPAQLNFGDCFSYALAKRLDVPLLYKGTDRPYRHQPCHLEKQSSGQAALPASCRVRHH